MWLIKLISDHQPIIGASLVIYSLVISLLSSQIYKLLPGWEVRFIVKLVVFKIYGPVTLISCNSVHDVNMLFIPLIK